MWHRCRYIVPLRGVPCSSLHSCYLLNAFEIVVINWAEKCTCPREQWTRLLYRSIRISVHLAVFSPYFPLTDLSLQCQTQVCFILLFYSFAERPCSRHCRCMGKPVSCLLVNLLSAYSLTYVWLDSHTIYLYFLQPCSGPTICVSHMDFLPLPCLSPR